MRAIPVLAILVWTYFAFPLLIGTSVNAFTAGVLALGFHLGAYVAETIRAGLTSVRPGQMRAALALGMGHAQAIRTIILPQALIRMLPPLGSLLVIAVKDSAIASVIAVPELMRQSQVLAGRTYRPVRDLHGRDAGLFLHLLPDGGARRRRCVYRRVAHWGRRDLRLVGRLGQSRPPARGRRGHGGAHRTTMALAIPGGLLLASLRLSPFAAVRAARHRLRRVLPRDAAHPADLLDVLRPARRLRRAALGVRDGDRRPGLNVSSFNSETFRAGIRSIRPGQWNAGLALGMGGPQVFFRIVLPQAAMRVLPALATTWVSLFKDTSLVSIIAVADLSYVALKMRVRDLPHPRGADRDGGALLADGLPAGQARSTGCTAATGWSNERDYQRVRATAHRQRRCADPDLRRCRQALRRAGGARRRHASRSTAARSCA